MEDPSAATCCICGVPCPGTPPSARAGGRRICLKCSASGARPPAQHLGRDDDRDDGAGAAIAVEGLSQVQLEALTRAQESPPPPRGPRPADHARKHGTNVTCMHCGQDVTGVRSATCPACGELSQPRTSQGRIAAENRKDYAQARRAHNIRTVTLACAGIVVTLLVRLVQQEWNLLYVDARYLGVGIPAALVVYYLSCLIFIGIDTPVLTNMVRLGSVLVACNALLAVLVALPASGCITLIVAPTVVLTAYIMLLKTELELDQMDAGLMGILSCGVMVGCVVASYWMW